MRDGSSHGQPNQSRSLTPPLKRCPESQPQFHNVVAHWLCLCCFLASSSRTGRDLSDSIVHNPLLADQWVAQRQAHWLEKALAEEHEREKKHSDLIELP